MIQRKLKNIDKTRDLIAVIHGIGPDGCNAVGAIMLKINSLTYDMKTVHCGAPLIELWNGLPTIHCALSKKSSQASKPSTTTKHKKPRVFRSI